VDSTKLSIASEICLSVVKICSNDETCIFVDRVISSAEVADISLDCNTSSNTVRISVETFQPSEIF
jgi:hypothetical protein